MNAVPGQPDENPALEAMRTWLVPLKADIDALDKQGPGDGRFLSVYQTMGQSYEAMLRRAAEAGIRDELMRMQEECLGDWRVMREMFHKVTPNGINSDKTESALTREDSVKAVARMRVYLGKLEALLA